MRSPRIASSVLFVLLALSVNISAAAAAGAWRTDFAAAEAEAKRLDKPMLLHFSAVWCGPCRQMEPTLNSPELRRFLEVNFIGVKVDVDKSPALQSKFQVESLPTDLIVGPDGRILSRSEGIVDKSTYLASVSRIDTVFAQKRRQQPQIAARPVAPPVAPVAPKVAAGPFKEKLVPNPIDPPEVAIAVPVQTPREEDRPTAIIALDGYCPVTLRSTRTWKAGQKEFRVEHKGLVFFFASQKQVDDFKADPARFSPKLLGCDPVILSDNELAILGSTKFGAFYEGELYLFETAENRSRFRNDPTKYSRTTHVLNPSEIKRRS